MSIKVIASYRKQYCYCIFPACINIRVGVIIDNSYRMYPACISASGGPIDSSVYSMYPANISITGNVTIDKSVVIATVWHAYG